jgi:hypothetical protein
VRPPPPGWRQKGLRSPRKRRGRRIVRTNVAISAPQHTVARRCPGRRLGSAGIRTMAITVARASRVISGESPPHARRPAGRQTEAAYLVGPLGVQLPRRLTEKVSQESVTSEPDNSSQDNHGGADYYGNGNKGRKERHDTGSLKWKAPVAGTRSPGLSCAAQSRVWRNRDCF